MAEHCRPTCGPAVVRGLSAGLPADGETCSDRVTSHSTSHPANNWLVASHSCNAKPPCIHMPHKSNCAPGRPLVLRPPLNSPPWLRIGQRCGDNSRPNAVANGWLTSSVCSTCLSPVLVLFRCAILTSCGPHSCTSTTVQVLFSPGPAVQLARSEAQGREDTNQPMSTCYLRSTRMEYLLPT